MAISVGVDLHKTQFTYCCRGPESMFGKCLTTPAGYAQFLNEMQRLGAGGERVQLAVESTGNTRFFKSQMTAAGLAVTVINPLKFKVINESVKKTDRHDAATIAEFLEKDMLPEAWLCSEESETIRRLLKSRQVLVRTEVAVKNQIHGLLTSLGMEDKKSSLQSKRGRKEILSTLEGAQNGLVVHTLFTTIEMIEGQVKALEKDLEELVKDDKVVSLLRTMPGCGLITASLIRAYTDDIRRFRTFKQYSAYAGLAPWVQCSNETSHYGSITKRGPEQLRTAMVQLVLGMVRMKKKTLRYRLMERYQIMKQEKGSGKSIIATARKLSKVIYFMLVTGREFDPSLMIDKKLSEKADAMQASFKQSA